MPLAIDPNPKAVEIGALAFVQAPKAVDPKPSAVVTGTLAPAAEQVTFPGKILSPKAVE